MEESRRYALERRGMKVNLDMCGGETVNIWLEGCFRWSYNLGEAKRKTKEEIHGFGERGHVVSKICCGNS